MPGGRRWGQRVGNEGSDPWGPWGLTPRPRPFAPIPVPRRPPTPFLPAISGAQLQAAGGLESERHAPVLGLRCHVGHEQRLCEIEQVEHIESSGELPLLERKI